MHTKNMLCKLGTHERQYNGCMVERKPRSIILTRIRQSTLLGRICTACAQPAQRTLHQFFFILLLCGFSLSGLENKLNLGIKTFWRPVLIMIQNMVEHAFVKMVKGWLHQLVRRKMCCRHPHNFSRHTT